MILLDNRLQTAASFYEPCELGADIGTDHGLLPCWLLQQKICKRMIMGDISSKALQHAQKNVNMYHLEAQARTVCASGVACLGGETAGCISITGMGGKEIASILKAGQDALHSAVLVLSAHTDLPVVRRTIPELGYHFTKEHISFAAGRYYLIWRAEPGAGVSLSEADVEFGTSLMTAENPEVLRGYREKCIRVLREHLEGLEKSSVPDPEAVEICRMKMQIMEERFRL